MERFTGGLVSKALRLLYHSTLGSRVIRKQKKKRHRGTVPRPFVLGCGVPSEALPSVDRPRFLNYTVYALSLDYVVYGGSTEALPFRIRNSALSLNSWSGCACAEGSEIWDALAFGSLVVDTAKPRGKT